MLIIALHVPVLTNRDYRGFFFSSFKGARTNEMKSRIAFRSFHLLGKFNLIRSLLKILLLVRRKFQLNFRTNETRTYELINCRGVTLLLSWLKMAGQYQLTSHNLARATEIPRDIKVLVFKLNCCVHYIWPSIYTLNWLYNSFMYNRE